MSANAYDACATEYDRENASSLLNAYYERPAMLELAGDVAGLDVLDAGCGSGRLAEALIARGAMVTGFDGSGAMIELARERLGPDVPLVVGDIGSPLPFADDSFDVVSASLVLHYVEDWSVPLAEFHRCLRPGGRLIISTNHPTTYCMFQPDRNQFAVHSFEETYEFAGRSQTLTLWHRPLSAMTRAFTDAGFVILAIEEPALSADAPVELLPPKIRSGERYRFYSFIFFALQAE